MELTPALRPRTRGRERARRGPCKKIWVVAASVMIVVLGLVAWVGVRAILAGDELESAIPLASAMQQQVVAGDGDAARLTGLELGERAASAASLTSDPVWRMFEGIPALGANLVVVRQLAAVVDDLAQGAVTPLADVAGAITTADFKPINGSINLQPLVDAQPAVSAAAVAVHTAKEQVDAIDAEGTINELTVATARLSGVVTDADVSIAAVDNAVRLLPVILGGYGPRDYLVLFQNPAELRSTGGIAGAAALLHTQDGQMQLVRQVSSTEYASYDAPVLDLPMETRGIYGDDIGQYLQDVNLTPNFAQSAELAQEMWRLQFGEEVDGVLSIDPVALSYLLRATGPITLSTGDVLSSDNAVQVLLSEVYSRYPDAERQDAFFAAAAASVFSAVASGDADPVTLITALAQAGAEHRVLIWSSEDSEQAVLANTTLAGGLPVSDTNSQRFGVYFNDATAAKMGPYLDVKTAVGQSTCRTDNRPNYVVDVTLTNNAPADASTSLPTYVTAGGSYGTPAGNIRTIVSVYGAPGMENLGVTRDGVSVPYLPATDSTYPLSNLTLELAPGETSVLRFSWLGDKEFEGNIELQMTPVIHRNETLKLDAAC
jgi:hypothetical protein